MKAAVLGSPVSHSLSPLIFNYICFHANLDLDYQRRDLTEKEVEHFFKREAQGYVGFNITIPLKEILFKKAGKLSEAAKAIGAINVLCNYAGEFQGHNTDVIGIQTTIELAGLNVTGSECLVLGAGGAAKAVLFYLGKRKVKKVCIYNRSQRGKEVSDYFSKVFPETSFEFSEGISEFKNNKFSLVVNSTPLGMSDKFPPRDYFNLLGELHFTDDALAFDLIYTKEITPFLEMAQKNELTVVNGLGMFIDQALATYEIWFGKLNNWGQMHEGLRKYLTGILKLKKEAKSIFLCGIMGSGKSTSGQLLADILGRDFIDLDKEIEEKACKSITEIFKENGESFFRELESNILTEMAGESEYVISLGGGSLQNNDNLKIIKDNGHLVYLEVTPELAVTRAMKQPGTRPLLIDLDEAGQVEKIKELLAMRIGQYESAPIKVNSSALSPDEVAFEIVKNLGDFL